MTLAPGTKLGPYEILSPLGAGGMGEVWKARDARLDRLVAIKVLPEHLTANADALARFEREAKAVAALNHPNITGIFDLGREGATSFAVMELLEGESLRARLAQGPLPPRRAVDLAAQMAQGLAAAHEKGVIHRDLKPDNLWITKDGRLKILDFGLAKQAPRPVSGTGANSLMPTEAVAGPPSHHTEAGLILGTAGYMSPEQVRGEGVDARSDLFSFGVVLYEMLSGKKPFARGSTSDTLAAILRDDPPELEGAGGSIPPGLARVIQHCLEKDPAHRFQQAHDLAFALGNLSFGSERTVAFTAPFASRNRRTTLLWAGLIALAFLGASAAAWWMGSRAGTPPLRKLTLPVSELRVGIDSPPMLSPDGKRLLYVAGRALWVRDLDQLEARRVVADVRLTFPTWSPDGADIAYLVHRQVFRVPAQGGTPLQVGTIPTGLGGTTPGLAWLADGRIAFAPAANGSTIYVVPAQGGEFTELFARTPGVDSDFHKPSVLPDGRSLLYVADMDVSGANVLEVFKDGKRKVVLRIPDEQREILDSPVYAPSGHILFHRRVQGQGIWALPFSLRRLEATGSPFLLVPSGRWPSVSRDGSLLYCSADDSLRQLALVDRERKVTLAAEPSVYCSDPRFSPDGTRLAWASSDIMLTDLRRKTTARLTFDNAVNNAPAWAADGNTLFFTSRQGGAGRQIARVPVDGSASPVLLSSDQGGSYEYGFQPCPSRDGRWVVFTRIQPGLATDLFAMDTTQGSKVSVVFSGPGAQTNPALSPDNRYLLYQSDETGHDEIHVRTFPDTKGHWQISTKGGTRPRWSVSGDRIYFLEGETLMEVDVSQKPAFTFGVPRRILDLDGTPVFLGTYDVSPDGRTFAMVVEVDPSRYGQKAMTLVENWAQELERRKSK